MSSPFLKREITFLILLLLFTGLLLAIHSYIAFHFYNETALVLPLYAIYGFHFLTVFVFYTLINYKYSTGKKNILPLFLGATLIKMILCVVFLLPVIFKPNENATIEVLNFFIPYFIFLAFEIGFITHFLKDK